MGVGTRKWKKADGTVCEAYIVRWTDAEGRHIKTFERKKDADAFDAETRLNKATGKHVALPRKLTVADAGKKWVDNVQNARNGRAQTLTQYRQHLKDHIEPMLGTARLVDLTRADCEKFRNDLLTRKMVRKAREGEAAEQNLSRATALKIWVSFKSLMRHNGRGAVVDGIDFERKETHGIEAAKDYPTIDEVRRISGKIGNVRDRAVFAILAGCGLRGGELRALRWCDVDLRPAAPRITVQFSADRFGGMDLPKTQHGRRTVPMPEQARADLVTWKAERKPAADTELIFATPDGKPLHHHTLVRALNGAQKAAEVVDAAGKPKYALHAFRHFFASWSLARIEDGGRQQQPHWVSKWLGHASFAITQAVYHHLFPSTDDSEFAAAASALFGPADKVTTQEAEGAKIIHFIK